MNAPKILQITSRADWGGGPEHINQLIQRIIDSFEIFIACPNDFPYNDCYKRITGPCRILHIPHRKFSLITLIKIIKFIKAHNIKIIHSHGKGAGLYSRLAAYACNIPCIHTFHGVHTDKYNRFTSMLYTLYEKCMSKITTRIIAVSQSEYETLISSNICTPYYTTIIRNGVNIPTHRTGYDTFSPPYSVLLITRFDPVKNTELILPILHRLKATGHINSFRFIITGDGPGREQLEAKIHFAGFHKQIQFTGAVTKPFETDRPLLCFLSTSHREGLPLSILEASAHSLPIVATDVPGNSEAVENNITGILCKPNDAVSISNALILLASNHELASKLGNNGRKHIQNNFSADRMAADISNLYLDLLMNTNN